MRDHSNHKAGTRHEVVGALLARWQFERDIEEVPVTEAAGRVAAQRVVSRNTLPNALTSNMDAIAVHFDDFAAGIPDTSNWTRGVEWQFCNTGVAVPAGFDTAIRIEDVEVSEDSSHVKILAAPAERGASTSEPGSTLQPGDLLVRAGEKLSPVKLAVLHMGGHETVKVIRRPRVVFIPTGNELVDVAPELPLGKNVESNGVLICSKIDSWGGQSQRVPIVPDKPDQILAALKKATAQADIVVINAGSSKGSDDWTCEILEREGEVLYHEVKQGPGRHCSFSLLDGKPVIGISGPPIGAEFTVDFFVKPFIDAYLGASLDYPPTVRCMMLDSAEMRPRPVEVLKRIAVRRDAADHFVGWQVGLYERPALRGCDDANALYMVPMDSYGWRAGDTIEVELRYPYTLPPRLAEE